MYINNKHVDIANSGRGQDPLAPSWLRHYTKRVIGFLIFTDVV